ncbi:MAG TPA: hypothetical protein VIC71_00125, partial [Gammaproteobacteria bacterium]
MRLRANVLWRIAAACAASAIAVAVDAQPPARTPTPNDSLISPRVAADGRVTISIYAPKASEVAVTGDWQTPFAPVALQKSAEGVWSIDVGPLPADLGRFARSGTDRRRSERSGACTSTHGGGDEDSGWSTIGRAGALRARAHGRRDSVRRNDVPRAYESR